MFRLATSTPVLGRLVGGLGAVAVAVGTGAGGPRVAHTSGDQIPAAEYPWSHRLPWQSFDYASVRRGFEVYQQVCAACHSLQFLNYRNLVGAVLTEDEAKEMAADTDVEDGPDNTGEMFERPGKLTDPLPRPYKNDEEARAGNNGSLPPDLSLITKARVGFEDYVFALLTGYRDAPHGVEVREGMHYNPYFPTASIGMKQALLEGAMEYEDESVEATPSQMAKDVTTFLAWAAEPRQDERKKMGIKAMLLLSAGLVPALWWKRKTWGYLKSRKIQYKP